MSNSAVACVWVALHLNDATVGTVELEFPRSASVDRVRGLVKSDSFPNHLASFDRSDIRLYLSSSTGIKQDPPAYTGSDLDSMETLSAVLPSPLPPGFVLLAMAASACGDMGGGVWGKQTGAYSNLFSSFQVLLKVLALVGWVLMQSPPSSVRCGWCKRSAAFKVVKSKIIPLALRAGEPFKHGFFFTCHRKIM